MEKDFLKLYDIKILILSRGRSGKVTTVHLVPDYIEVLVPESEKEQYESTLTNKVLTIPDSFKGLGQVRNWVLDNFKEETIIMMDDDLTTLYCMTEEKARNIKDKEEVIQILINSAVMAKDMGVHCFGYSQTDIRKFNGTEPFRLSTWVGGVIGVIGRKYRFRNDYFKVDIDFCLKNLLVDRIIFMDNRYYFIQNRDNNTGGNSAFRTMEAYQKSCETLKRKWGKYIKIKMGKGSQISISLNVKRKQEVKI